MKSATLSAVVPLSQCSGLWQLGSSQESPRWQGERITTNTLIRVFVAAGLARADQLAGTTGEELRRSLGLPD